MAKRALRSAATKRSANRARPAHGTEARPKGFDKSIGYSLRLAYNLQVQRFATVGGAFNIRPPQFAVLNLVYHVPQLNQTEIAEALSRKHANVVALLDELEGRGLLNRVQDKSDKRIRIIHLTPAGKRLTAKLLDRQARLYSDLEDAFGARRLERLFELLDAFCDLDPDPTLDY